MSAVSALALAALPGTAAATSYGGPAAFDLAVSPVTLFPIGGAAMTRARQIADAHWGYDPCGGNVALTWEAGSPTINATSTWYNPTDPYNNPSQNYNCAVVFNSVQGFDWPMLCTVFMHEFGHLTGHMHSLDPNDVMAPIYSQPTSECRTEQPVATAPPPPPPPPTAAPATTHAQGTAGTHTKAPPRHRHKRKPRHRTRGAHRSRHHHRPAR